MIGRLKQIFIKEFLSLIRDKRMLAIIFVLPVIQIVIFARAFMLDVNNVGFGLLDRCNSPLSRQIISRFVGSGYFHLKMVLKNENELKSAFDSNKIRAAFVFQSDFDTKANSGKKASFMLITDGSTSNDAGIITGYANMIFNKFITENTSNIGIEVKNRAWFNVNFKSQFFYVPGLIGILMVVISFLTASISIVKEKEVGTIEQIMVTPIKTYEFIIGKTFPFLIIGYIVMTLMLLSSFSIYGLSVKGSWLLLYAVAGIFICGNLGAAIIISVISTTQQQALLTSFFFMLPSVMLSGIMFPVRNMPIPIQDVIMLNPLRWFFQSLIEIVIKGASFTDLIVPILAQTILATLFISIAIIMFKKKSS